MNQICVRTIKGDFADGEIIYGVVYVNINGPTSGTGVKLHFLAYEEFRDQKAPVKGRSETLESINWELKLYENNGKVLPRGNFMLPFQVKLQDDLPSSFCMVEDEFCGCLSYHLAASLTGDENVNDSIEVVVQRRFDSTRPGDGVTNRMSYKWKLLINRSITLHARFLQSSYLTGGLADLQLNIDKPSGPLNSVTVKLIRTLKVLMRSKRASCDTTSRLSSCSSWPSCDSATVNLDPMEYTAVMWDQVFKAGQQLHLDKIKSVMVPLTNCDGKDLPASTDGSLLQCGYHVLVDVDIDGTNKVNVQVPVNIYMSNKKWKDWLPPPWSYHCNLKEVPSICTVPQYVLLGEEFLGMPGFQRL